MSGAADSTLTPAPEAPPQEPVAAAPEAAPPAPPADPDATELAELEANAVVLPDGADGLGKYVPLSAATTAREEAKRLRGEGKTLKEQLAQAQAAAAAAAPYVEAAKAILQQPQAQPPQPQGPSQEERAELEEVARDLDFYKTDGSLDLDRAGRHQARIVKAAEKMAAAHVAPLQHEAAIERARGVLTAATSWKHPVTGEQADPGILRNMWNKVAGQPGGLETLANPEAAMFVWGQALLATQVQRGPQAPAPTRTPAPDGPPMFVETSGGGGDRPTALNSMERRAIAESGMTEAEYLKEAAKRPRG